MFDRLLLALDDSPAGEVATLFATALARAAARPSMCSTSTSSSSAETGFCLG